MSRFWGQRWQSAILLVLAAAGVGGYVVVAESVHTVGFPLDDAWIHQTFARNLVEYGEWAFIPGSPSAASTSPLYTVLLAAGYFLHIPFFVWTFAVGAVTLFAGGWIASRLAEDMFPTLPRAALWTGLAVVLAWHLVWAAASGMETMLFATLSLAFVGVIWRWAPLPTNSDRPGSRAGRGFLTGILGAALTLTRPEGMGLIALGVAVVWLANSASGRVTGWRQLLFWTGGVLGGWLIGVLPYALLNYHISGGLLPETSAAKQAENAPALALPLWERYGRMLLPLAAGGQIALVPGIVVGLGLLIRRARQDLANIVYWLPAAWVFMLVSAYAFRLPAPYQHGRYVIPALPFLLLYGVSGTLWLIKHGARSRIMRVATRSLGLSAACIMLAFWWIGAQAYARDVRIINTEMVDTAHWVARNLDPGDLLAVHDIGAVGYYASRPIVDFAGLVTPEIVPALGDSEAVMRFLCEEGAEYLMVLPSQLPVSETDTRLGGAPVFTSGAPYSPAAGGGNMTIYRLQWPAACQTTR